MKVLTYTFKDILYVIKTECQWEAVCHYKKMIDWAKTQPGDDPVDEYKMEYFIGVEWFSNNCAYCQKYSGGCEGCLLLNNEGCCDDLWGKMNRSKTWGEWILRAEDVLEYILVNG